MRSQGRTRCRASVKAVVFMFDPILGLPRHRVMLHPRPRARKCDGSRRAAARFSAFMPTFGAFSPLELTPVGKSRLDGSAAPMVQADPGLHGNTGAARAGTKSELKRGTTMKHWIKPIAAAIGLAGCVLAAQQAQAGCNAAPDKGFTPAVYRHEAAG